MPRSTASGLRITPSIAAFYNYQIHPSSVEAEVSVFAQGVAPRGFHGIPKPQATGRGRATGSGWEA
jgi:hypothetical protein